MHLRLAARGLQQLFKAAFGILACCHTYLIGLCDFMNVFSLLHLQNNLLHFTGIWTNIFNLYLYLYLCSTFTWALNGGQGSAAALVVGYLQNEVNSAYSSTVNQHFWPLGLLSYLHSDWLDFPFCCGVCLERDVAIKTEEFYRKNWIFTVLNQTLPDGVFPDSIW